MGGSSAGDRVANGVHQFGVSTLTCEGDESEGPAVALLVPHDHEAGGSVLGQLARHASQQEPLEPGEPP
jgi:hypothetical protein